jgi:hypothetical protein
MRAAWTLSLLLGIARAAAAPIALATPPSLSPVSASGSGMRPGEAFTFKFSVGPVEGGRARMSVGRPLLQAGRRIAWVHAEAETNAFISLIARIHDDYKLSFDVANLLPLSAVTVERGLRERRITATIDGRRAHVDFWAPEKRENRQRLMPKLVRDPVTALFALRALPLVAGQTIDLDVLDGAALWHAHLVVHGSELLHIDADAPGTPGRHALRIDGETARLYDDGRPLKAPKRTITIWLSDDSERVLLRCEADTDLGRASMELTRYIRPASPPSERAPELPGIEASR